LFLQCPGEESAHARERGLSVPQLRAVTLGYDAHDPRATQPAAEALEEPRADCFWQRWRSQYVESHFDAGV
jgi:hypothetical protein